METTTPACVAIDLDLAYDIWSLLFCCITSGNTTLLHLSVLLPPFPPGASREVPP